jgi:hypothetical protein
MGDAIADKGYHFTITDAFSVVLMDVCNAIKATNARHAIRVKGLMKVQQMVVAIAVQTIPKLIKDAFSVALMGVYNAHKATNARLAIRAKGLMKVQQMVVAIAVQTIPK